MWSIATILWVTESHLGKEKPRMSYSLWEMEYLYSLEVAGIENPIGIEIWSGGYD